MSNDMIFVDGKGLDPLVISLVQRSKALSNFRDAYQKLWRQFSERLPLLEDAEFWEVLNAYRELVVLYRFNYGRTNGVKQAAEELCRRAWVGEGEFNLNTIFRFAKTYPEVGRKMAKVLPDEYGGGDSYTDAKDNLPLCGGGFPLGAQFLDVESFRLAVRNALQGMDEKLPRFITAGENYNAMSLREAAEKYAQLALADVDCPITDEDRYLRIELDRESIEVLLETTTGPLTVQTKLDDEGVVLDLIDSEGGVIDSTWKLYSDAGLQVVTDEDE